MQWKYLCSLLFLLLLLTSGCGMESKEEDLLGTIRTETEEIAELYRDIYEDAKTRNSLADTETALAIAARLGESGFCVTDAENQNLINLTNHETMEAFCSLVDDGRDGEAVFFCVMQTGGLLRFDLTSAGGEVSVVRTVLSWEEEKPSVTYQSSYAADGWTYEDGCLFFEEAQPVAYDGAPSYTALRIQPLDEACLKWNRECLRLVGYPSNNLFFLDWTEEDYGSLNFYDLFAILYPIARGIQIPYEQTVDGTEYQVPAEEVASVIQTFFSIDSETLQQIKGYQPDTDSYVYQTRSFTNKAGSPNSPYPEAVSCRENADSTLTLTVRAVWPSEHLPQAFSHEVTIRPLPDGGFQFVSNRMLPSAEDVFPSWVEEVLRESSTASSSSRMTPTVFSAFSRTSRSASS